MVSYEFPRPAVTIDVVAFSIADRRLRLLLIRRNEEPFRGKWTVPGGFLHEGETLEACVLRVLSAKTGLKDVFVEQLATFGHPDRDPRDRVISVAYFAILPVVDDDRDRDALGGWHDVAALPEMGFDHAEIARTGVERLRAKLDYASTGFEFLPGEFTLGELQQTWEAVLDRPLDKRNFRKSILNRKRVAATGKKSKGGAHPPASLYRRA